MRLRIAIITILLAGMMIFTGNALAACDDKDVPHPIPDYSLVSLKPADSWDAVMKQIQENYIREMEQHADKNLETALHFYKNGCPAPSVGACDGGGSSGPAPGGDGSSGSGGNDTASEYSETNTQVPGVDEADFIKNDGGYIYMLSDNQLRIIDAWPAEEASVLSTTPIEGRAGKLYVYNNKALVYSSIAEVESVYDWPTPRECTYGYDCRFTGDSLNMKISIFDITDKTAPKLERETLFHSSYLNSRRIGNVVHTAVISLEYGVQGLVYWPSELPSCPNNVAGLTEAGIIAAFTQMKKANAQRIMEQGFPEIIKAVKDTRYIDGKPVVTENVLADCNRVYISRAPGSKSLLFLASLEIDALSPLSITTIVGKPGPVHANKDAFYVAARQSRPSFGTWYFKDSERITEATTVQKFRLSSGTETTYAAGGVVKGKVLNQFSMDEQNGYLRMATTTGKVAMGGSDVHSTLVTLKEDGDKLMVAGMVDDIAPSEDIRSVRFNGDAAFIVTFKKTDPLFAFDLSDPENPVLAGELKIPGFSTYMHLMDDRHLLTIGFDAEDNDVNAYFQGVMLQIFDVSRMSSPKLIHKEVIGTRGTTSDAIANHLAFNYFAPKDLLALPMVVCEASSDENNPMWSYGDYMTFSGLMVYKVTTDKGFKFIGGIPHVDPETPDTYSGYCNNWWTHANSLVKRSIVMDDYVYSVAPNSIRIAHINALGAPIAHIKLMEQ